MTTPDQLLAHARSHLGVTESPAGSNRQPFAAIAGHANGYAWCATFGVAMQILAGLEPVSRSAYTPRVAVDAAAAGRTVRLADARPGDHAVVDFPGGKGRIEHYIILEQHLGGTVWQTIEGNTSSAGSQTNGGAVLRKRRDLGAMVTSVVFRPRYTGATAGGGPVRPEGALLMEGDAGDAVVVWQQQLVHAGGADLVVDGDFGPLTAAATRAWQATLGLPTSGMVGAGDIAAMEAVYAAMAAARQPVVPDLPAPLREAVRYADGVAADERIARGLAAHLHAHVGSLAARQRVGTVYLVGRAAAGGYDRQLADRVVTVAGTDRHDTHDRAHAIESDHLNSL
ncbi:peptidoglycan-binding domain-containing protein [Euzebya rosea]|uniref:peptidoglycan-binding domain-containing protein n=1 Tax=Euzebya rosea TaxID=2052804 RepID=UPI000D3E7561|nr:peptidoglycan-binding domain-containing protein [Euzebya rosea]